MQQKTRITNVNIYTNSGTVSSEWLQSKSVWQEAKDLLH